MGATPTGATPTGPTLDPLNILVNKFNIATHVALILFLFSSWINYLLYDTKSVMVFCQLLSKIKRFVTIFRISWNGPTLFNIPIGDFPPCNFCTLSSGSESNADDQYSQLKRFIVRDLTDWAIVPNPPRLFFLWGRSLNLMDFALLKVSLAFHLMLWINKM